MKLPSEGDRGSLKCVMGLIAPMTLCRPLSPNLSPLEPSAVGTLILRKSHPEHESQGVPDGYVTFDHTKGCYLWLRGY